MARDAQGEGIEVYTVKVNGFSDPLGCLLDGLSVSWKVRRAAATPRRRRGDGPDGGSPSGAPA